MQICSVKTTVELDILKAETVLKCIWLHCSCFPNNLVSRGFPTAKAKTVRAWRSFFLMHLPFWRHIISTKAPHYTSDTHKMMRGLWEPVLDFHDALRTTKKWITLNMWQPVFHPGFTSLFLPIFWKLSSAFKACRVLQVLPKRQAMSHIKERRQFQTTKFLRLSIHHLKFCQQLCLPWGRAMRKSVTSLF